MGSYIFTLTPTFTQGLILGQLSILLLVYVILKFLFFESKQSVPESLEDKPFHHHTSSFATELSLPSSLLHSKLASADSERADRGTESAEWLNVLLQQILDEYRCKLSAEDEGIEGQQVVLKRIQAFANNMRPQTLLGPIKINSINLGVSAPRLSNARTTNCSGKSRQVEFDLTYIDTASISLSTSVLFNYPLPAFARLPLSLVISMELFSSSMIFTPPIPATATMDPQLPSVTFAIPPSSVSLRLKIASTMGSRAQLADVPKLHELIESQVKKIIMEKGTWKVALPGLDTSSKRRQDDMQRFDPTPL